MVDLLVMAMARILLLAWSIVQHLDHNAPVDPLRAASDSMTESPFSSNESAVSEEEKLPSGLRYIGPPQFWMQLQATQSCEDPVLQSSLHVEASSSEASGAAVPEKAAPEMARPQDSDEVAPSPAQSALFEPTQPYPQAADSEPLALAGAEGMGGRNALQFVAEHASLISKTIAVDTTSPKSTNSTIMQEIMNALPPAKDAFSPPMSVQNSGITRTAVQLTFPLEIVSLQLTPAFKMRDLQLRSSSQLVTMRLASGNASQPPINLEITFEIAKIELENGAIRAIRLLPSDRQRPAAAFSSSFAVAGLELEASSKVASVLLARPLQAGASVYLMADFQIAAIEFSACFGVAAIVLNSTSRDASLQLPGAETNPIGEAPIFAIERVELNGSQLGLIQVTQLGSGKP
jgi:hypothetical protein